MTRISQQSITHLSNRPEKYTTLLVHGLAETKTFCIAKVNQKREQENWEPVQEARMQAKEILVKHGLYTFEEALDEIERDDKVAKFWLRPVRLERSGGFSRREINRIQKLVENIDDRCERFCGEEFQSKSCDRRGAKTAAGLMFYVNLRGTGRWI